MQREIASLSNLGRLQSQLTHCIQNGMRTQAALTLTCSTDSFSRKKLHASLGLLMSSLCRSASVTVVFASVIRMSHNQTVGNCLPIPVSVTIPSLLGGFAVLLRAWINRHVTCFKLF